MSHNYEWCAMCKTHHWTKEGEEPKHHPAWKALVVGSWQDDESHWETYHSFDAEDAAEAAVRAYNEEDGEYPMMGSGGGSCVEVKVRPVGSDDFKLFAVEAEPSIDYNVRELERVAETTPQPN